MDSHGYTSIIEVTFFRSEIEEFVGHHITNDEFGTICGNAGEQLDELVSEYYDNEIQAAVEEFLSEERERIELEEEEREDKEYFLMVENGYNPFICPKCGSNNSGYEEPSSFCNECDHVWYDHIEIEEFKLKFKKEKSK